MQDHHNRLENPKSQVAHAHIDHSLFNLTKKYMVSRSCRPAATRSYARVWSGETCGGKGVLCASHGKRS